MKLSTASVHGACVALCSLLSFGAALAAPSAQAPARAMAAVTPQFAEFRVEPDVRKGLVPERAAAPVSPVKGLTYALDPAAGVAKGLGYAGEIEPNGSAAAASPLAVPQTVVRASLYPNGDVDVYSFTATAGDRVYAATMTSGSAGSSTDSQLTLLDSDGTTVLEFDDDNGTYASLSSSIAGTVIPATGTYFLRVNDFTAGTTSQRRYELYFRLQSGTPTPEVEANDTPATANPLPAGGWVSGARSPAAATEQDWYSLNLNAGDTVFLSLDLDPEDDLVTWNGRLGFALFGDAGNQILATDDAGTGDVAPNPNRPSEAMFFTVKTAGTYFAFVDSASGAVGGPTATYHLNVSVFPNVDEGVNCTTYTSTNVPQTIGPGTGLVSSTITVPGNPRIADLDVSIELNHALMQDMDVHLRSPAGNNNGLFSDIGAAATGGQQQMDVTFDDEAAIPPAFTALRNMRLKPENNSTAGTASTSGAYRLDWFDGENAGGTWTLDIYDDTAGANGGTLTSWSLHICEMPPPPTCAPGFAPTTVYSTDFESGDAGFTHAGTQDEWELGLPATVATTTANPIAAFNTCHSGVNCWKTDLDNTYNASSNQDLLSPNINLAGLSAPVVITWAQRHQVEAANFDHMFVDAQQVGGATPVRLYEWLGPTPISASAGTGNPQNNIGGSAGWGLMRARADSLAGLNTELRFHLDSDTTVQFGGLAIDDVSVTACRALSADLSITKTDGVGSVPAGGSTTYTITASNVGPDPVTGATVADTFPAALTCTWTCVGAGGGTCTAAGSGNINDSVNLPAGGSTTYTASCAVSPAASGLLSNTATVSSTIGDPDGSNNSATDTDTLLQQADLSITKTDGVLTAVPGGSVTYTITASNAGPSNATGAAVADTFPASQTCTWTCVGAGGGTCTAAGSGNIGDTVNLPAGGSTTYTAVCAISAAATGTLSNTATVTEPAGVTDGNPGNNSDTDTDTLTPTVDLAISKTDGVPTAIPGGSVTYSIGASNLGPSNASGATVVDTFPASLTCTWTCVGAGGATCTAAGSGNIADTVNLPPGSSTNYTASCAISAAATGTLSNTATVIEPAGTTDSNPGNNAATDDDTLTPQANLSITADDGVTAVTAGDSTVYTIFAFNGGPSTVPTAAVTNAFPSQCDSVTWSCAGSGGGTCTASGSGDIADTVNLPPSGGVTYTATCAINPLATGPMDNVASIATGDPGIVDPLPGNDSDTDSNTVNPAPAVVSATKTVAGAFTPGTDVTYTIVLQNSGGAQADNPGDEFVDVLPPSLTLVSASASSGAAIASVGTNTVTWNGAIAASGSVTITIVATIDASATGTVANQGTVSFDGDADGSNETSVPTDDPGTAAPNDPTGFVVGAGEADLSITKSDGVDDVIAGTSTTYTIVAANAGPSDVDAASITDTLPAACTGATWTATGSGGAGGFAASGSGNIAANGVTLPVGASVTYSVTCPVDAGATGTLANTATVSSAFTDPVPGNDSATDSTTVLTRADLSIVKSDGVASVAPGATLTYTIVASNAGPSNATGVAVADTFPATCTAVAYTATGSGGASGFTASGTGNIADAALALPAGASVQYLATCTVDEDAADATAITNTATVTAAAGVDTNPANDSAVDDTTVDVVEGALVGATKTVAGTFAQGDTVTYTIVLQNTGAGTQADNPGDEFVDPLPAGLTYVGASATSGSTAFAAGSVTWNGSIPAGGSVTITIVASIDADATGTIANQGTVNYDTDADGTNEATAQTDDPSETGTANPTGFEVEEGTVEPPAPLQPAVIPATSLPVLFALALLLLGIGWRRRLG
ncbi:beta strand repeat-containing protein [Chiayiivirga flava]|uniref:Putative repeat protein (TIGR01451 family) n=1 Tax=Chiayiivirga flava TaxID=659595 RepID=A0A7W8D7D9_9GAMM|nr:proprotein convertase P-domain-containing protein [Chiayiivirga flava]MBB5208051.1 putative repeat protein (TIGR01451 family) [Chiayiivirga flava]